MNDRDRLNGKMVIALWRSYYYAHKRSMSLFRENGLTMAQFTVMEALYNKGEMTVKQIVSRILSSNGNMTVVIRNLEAAGLVLRRENPEDARSFLISLTPKGHSVMDFVFPRHMQNFDEAFKNLTDQEKNTIISLLKKLETNSKKSKRMWQTG